jgi:CheY-like chemotaxis protein
VLVAEDDAGVRALVIAVLQRYGYRVMAAVDGMQALELFRTYGHLIDIVVTDVNMPELKGPELVRILSDGGASLPVLYISGFTSEALSLGDAAPRHSFLAKPFAPVELARAVRGMLDANR